MFKRASFGRRSSNASALGSSPAQASTSQLPQSPPPSNASSLLARFKPSPRNHPTPLPTPPPPGLSRANTLPAIESSANSSRSSFTSVSSATRPTTTEGCEEGRKDDDDDVWAGEEEGDGRRPLVEVDDDAGEQGDDGTPTVEKAQSYLQPAAGAATSSSAANGDASHAVPSPNGNGHAHDVLSSSLPSIPSRPASPSLSPANPSAPGARPAHREHHHHHAVHHSPPVAGPPPIRAATLAGLKDVAAIAAASPGAKEAGRKKKGFMASFGRKAANPSVEGALALASLPSAPPAEELTPLVRMERAKQAERAHLLQICMELGVEIHDIAPDGHCMYAAVADQLAILKIIKEEDNNPRTTRAAAADYMLAHPDSFLPFLVGSAELEFGPAEDDVEGGEGETEAEKTERRRAVEDGMMTERAFKAYCERVRSSGEWGGEPEILALSRYYQIPIHVVQSNHPKIVAHSPDPKARATLDPRSARKIRAVRISYHRRLYGLGEHYNSLRKITYTLSAFSAMVPM